MLEYLNSLPKAKKFWIISILVLIIIVFLVILKLKSKKNTELVFNWSSNTFEVVNTSATSSSSQNNMNTSEHDKTDVEDKKTEEKEEKKDQETDDKKWNLKDSTISIHEWDLVTISKEEKEKNKTENLMKEVDKTVLKEEQKTWSKTEITNANDIEVNRKEIKIKWNVDDLKVSYKEIHQKIKKEFDALWISEQNQYIKNANTLIWKEVFTKWNYVQKIKKLLTYINKEKKYAMIEKITQLWIKEILNWNFLTTLKTDRMLYNNAILEIM